MLDLMQFVWQRYVIKTKEFQYLKKGNNISVRVLSIGTNFCTTLKVWTPTRTLLQVSYTKNHVWVGPVVL